MHIPGLLLRFSLLISLLSGVARLSAQENPPIPVSVEVNTSQFLNFGAFTVGPNGGTITVTPDGNRTRTGNIYLLHLGETPSPALFDVMANPGTIIQINAPGNVKLTGSNGGEIYLDINSFSTGNLFITTVNPPAVNSVFVGGMLRISNQAAAVPGRYNGTFTLIFNHE
ncbi:DUF4402 domain-containing protein [Autumnicola musiva]|uniref:DUF4402 domain-containing protein n=1 Tax=Autumnicola musiva TaxID=3075589 RepID=A0ABU3D5Z3_9FLAO|nr:DUF4402 domain-containing protein [Zunongwangia sp. F117]MDT0676950.1 DUF4402 domain-containing protein [Zunongwangia sp. F117]